MKIDQCSLSFFLEMLFRARPRMNFIRKTEVVLFTLLVSSLMGVYCQNTNLNYTWIEKALTNWTYCNDTFYAPAVQSIVGYDVDNDKVIKFEKVKNGSN